jgi:signal transduction histidine kinase
VAVDVDATGEQQSVTTRTDGRVREFAAVVSPLTDPAESVVGYTVVMQDVTDRRQREQRLSVLNRVLRHNLRNDMNVITGRADLIAAESDSESVRESAAVVVERAEALQDISERAHEFERVTESGLHSELVDATELIADLLADVRKRAPDAEITVESDGSTTVRTDSNVLELALSNLLDYALETDDDAPPRLSLTVGDADDGATLVVTVTDDGRGIARSELDPVELGQETDLQHATGIALWVVAWSVTALGGDIAFAESGDGTAVSIRLPRDAADEAA